MPDEVFWHIVGEHPLCVAHGTRALRRAQAVGLPQPPRVSSPRASTRSGSARRASSSSSRSPFPRRPRTRGRSCSTTTGATSANANARCSTCSQPHLLQLHDAAALRRRGTVARRLIEASTDSARACVLVSEATGAMEPVGERAREWLKAYFADGAGTHLPTALAEWLRRQRAAALHDRRARNGLPADRVRARRDRRPAHPRGAQTPDRRPPLLTPREQEVIALVADGLRNSEIAERLWVSPATVRKHLENIYDKLGVHTRTAAVARFQRSGHGRAGAA